VFVSQFAKLDAATLAFLTDSANVESLRSILLYHVLPVLVPAASIMNGDHYVTVEGTHLFLDVMGGTVMIGDATVTGTDVLASNGLAHVIDTVLTIPASLAPASAMMGTMAPAMMGTMAPAMAPAMAPVDAYSAASNSAFGFALALVGAVAILV
jgi:transforming growth factor-beta-induced protein